MQDAKESKDKNIISQVIQEITQPFKDLVKAPRALFGVNISYLIEGLAYFGILGLLAMYYNEYVGLNDIHAGQMVGLLTAGITIAMLALGATVDFIGVRRSLIIALATMFFGRVVLAGIPNIAGGEGLWSAAHLISILGLAGVVIGYGIYQPACYAAVRKFTNKDTAAMGYAMLYAIMNLGGFLPGLISPPVRKAFGITGVFWVYAALTIVGLVLVMIILSKKAIKDAMEQVQTDEEKEEEAEIVKKEKEPLKVRIISYIKRFPITDYRFMFFIFILIPVQTLFAHNWLTLPQYCERAFDGLVSENFEFFVNLNPIFIFVLTPMITALTMKKHTYKMMIIGTAIMGASPFILTAGPNIYSLFIYIIVLTIGEAMWQPRFLQWVAEIAPKDMTGIYMGLGQFPWFLTKLVTSLYSGWFLMNYCPDDMPLASLNTETMWLIYGFISISTPVALFFAKGWMMKGFKEKDEAAA